MKLLTRASAVAVAGLLTCGPVHTAHATTDADEDPTCAYERTDNLIKITVGDLEVLEDLVVRIDDEPVDHTASDDLNVVEVELPSDSDDPSRVEISSGENENPLECSDETEEPSDPTETPTEDESTPPETETPTEPDPGDSESTDSEPEEPTEPEETPPTEDPVPPENPDPTESDPSSPTPEATDPTTPASPGSPSGTIPTQVPRSQLPSETNRSEAMTDAGTSTEMEQSTGASEVDAEAPRQFRPLAESPRYLLPHLLGTRSAQRGSPLILPQPQNTHDRASELETLPPISEDELEAIKAELSSPGRADTATSGPYLHSATPDERISNNSSWWLVAGLTALLGLGGSGWLFLKRRKRRH